MYEIWVDDLLIHSDVTPSEDHKVLEPNLVMEDCAAGSLEFTMPPNNVGYTAIQKLVSDIIVYENDEEIWRGRCISETMDFWKNKKYVIEGALAFLNDTVQPPREFNVSNTTVRTFLEALIATHNNQAPANRRFKVGIVTVDDGDSQADDDAIHRYTNYESTLECINEKLVNKLKGHITVKREFDTTDNTYKFTINYVKDYIDAHDKEIRFGMNLLDYAQSYEVTDLVTAIVPRGARLDESPISALEAYTTVASCPTDGTWHTSGSIFVTNQPAIANYGFICGVVDWDNVTDPSNLLTKAKQYLEKVQWNKLCLEVSVLDLHYLDTTADTFKLLQEVRCVSEPHGMDAFFPVTKMEIDLSNPANTKFTLGTDYTPSLTSAASKINTDFLNYINNTPSESAVLKSAKENARAIIEGTADGGYVTFMYGTNQYGVPILDPTTGEKANPDRPTGLWVGDALSDENAINRWIWTYGGLMHQSKNTAVNPPVWKNPNVAITMDGQIVADRITTGYCYADRIRGGTLTLGGTLTKDGQTILDGYGKIDVMDASNNIKIKVRHDRFQADGGYIVTTGTGYVMHHQKDSGTHEQYVFDLGCHYCNCQYEYGGTWHWVNDGATAIWRYLQGAYNPSDQRSKTKIEELDPGFSKNLIMGTKPKMFEFKFKEGFKQFGMIAQDQQELLKDLGFNYSTDLLTIPEDPEEWMSIEYKQFVPHLINCVQDLYRKIDDQQKEIDELKSILQNKEKNHG